MKLTELTESSANLPEKFGNGDEFMSFVYDRWPSRETHVEMQGGGAWFAQIDGDPLIQQATFDEENGFVSWLDKEGNEV